MTRDRPQQTASALTPEPIQLTALLFLYFHIHIPRDGTGDCVMCYRPWPCDAIRLAYRLREGF